MKVSIKIKLTAWFMAIFLVVLLSMTFIMHFLINKGLDRNVEEHVNKDFQTLDNLIVSSNYDPFDLSYIGISNMFKIVDEEKTLCTSWLWEKSEIDKLEQEKYEKWVKFNNNYYSINKIDASPQAMYSIVRADNFLNVELQKNSNYFEDINNIPGIKKIRLPSQVKGKVSLIVAEDVTSFQIVKNKYVGDYMIMIPIALILALTGGYVLTGRFLSPIDKMTEKAREISAEKLSERLPVNNPDDELGKLAIVFNDTLSKLEGSFIKLSQFTADVSHELRTPLTSIRSIGEVALKGNNDLNKYREAIGSMLEEVDRLTSLIDNLLLLARANAGKITVKANQIFLNDLIKSIVEIIRPIAEEKKVELIIENQDNVEIFADKIIIRQAFINVLDNAISYTPGNSTVVIKTGILNNREVYIDISDQGPGIPVKERLRIFDRFYRLDNNRSREKGGGGLGLSIAKWAVEANKGTIEFIGEGNKGSICRIRLPLLK